MDKIRELLNKGYTWQKVYRILKKLKRESHD